MPRTAIRLALKQLGFNDTYHMDCLFENPSDIDLWRQAFLAKFKGQGKPFEKEQWDQLLGHCQAVCDLPTTAFVPELIAAYPDAKLILTPREENSWYASCQRTIQTAAMARSIHVGSQTSTLQKPHTPFFPFHNTTDSSRSPTLTVPLARSSRP